MNQEKMQRKLMLIFAALFLTCSLSAEQNKYYKKDRLVNTLYVNSIEGLKVRDTPSLNGKRICGLVNALPVKIVAVGSSAEIDGIKDNWVKILIPAYEWKTETPEYGWIFGGYLSELKPAYNLNSLADIKNFLSSKIWILEKGSFTKKFQHNEEFLAEKLAAGGGTSGVYKVLSKNSIKITSRFYDEYGTFEEETALMKLEILNENKIRLNGDVYVPYIDPVSYGNLEPLRDFVYGNYNGESIYSFVFKENPYNHKYTEEEILKVADELIKYGVDPAGSGYEERYEEYWSKIK